MEVFLDKKRVKLDPSHSIGKGGEADVFDLGDGRALKLFKPPTHPDYRGFPHEQQAARERLALHQKKLPAFPKGLPGLVVSPEELATDRHGVIVGYAMPRIAPAEPLYQLADPTFRRAGFPAGDVVAVFRAMHTTVDALHAAGVVIGDFNDRNVLLQQTRPHFIDADSFQFGGFPCPVFTDRFVDPLLCDPAAPALLLASPHTADSDWYAFAVLLMQSLLFVGPYGGIYRPKDPALRIPPSARPQLRITVFHPEVQYPKPALSPRVLPDDLLDRLQRIVVGDERGAFPPLLLETLRFERCPSCGVEHARFACPLCSPTAALKKQEVVRVRGEVTCRRLFATDGVILHSCVEGGLLRLVYHEAGAFRREDGRVLFTGPLDRTLRFAILGDATLVGRHGELATLTPGQAPQKLGADGFATNGRRRFWTFDGRLWRDGATRLFPSEPEIVGEVLSGQTRFWVGGSFGIGFYRAGTLAVAFVFDAERRGLNDQLRLPPLPGELLDAEAVLDERRAWLFLTVQERGRTRNLCLVYSRSGQLEASAEAQAGDGSWLGSLRGKCATAGMLLAATDAGLVRLEVQAGAVVQTREFPDTEPFVSCDCRLLIGKEGLLVVTSQHVAALQMP